MKFIGLTQRIVIDPHHQEKRDALDQRWASFLIRSGYIPYPIPNCIECLEDILTLPLDAVVLTGGGTLHLDCSERDLVETSILDHALIYSIPILGICRGMQVILNYFGAKLQKVGGHVNQVHYLEFNGRKVIVNSYHDYGFFDIPESFEVTARAEDGVIEAIRHRFLPIRGIMWHPERVI